jgi:hypothetical protein
MKIRSGFVSNSSSSSFVIDKYNLSQRQIDRITNHIEESKGMTARDEEWGWCNNEGDAWEITVDDEAVRGSTFMDSFDMQDFLRQIGVDDDDIIWHDSRHRL